MANASASSTAPVEPTLRRAAEAVWEYLRLVHEPAPADLILCLGSHDTAVPRHAAALWRGGWAPLIAISGGIAHTGDLANPGWGRPEAEVFADLAEASGVPRDAMLLETRATNTGENFALTRALLAERGHPVPRRVLVVAKPYMTRRALATGPCAWPGPEYRAGCEAVDLWNYLARDPDPARTLHLMAGDLHRILVYPRLGFQLPQDVPSGVLRALGIMVAGGYGGHLPSDRDA